MKTGRCPKCQSTEVEDRAEIGIAPADASKWLEVETCDDPDAMLLKGRHTSKVAVHVCATCGFIELYAQAPEKLRTKREA